MPEISVTGTIGGKEFVLSTGKLAGQADGAVVARLGGTEMLVTATANRKIREGVDFFPLTVDFEERMYSVGKIPGSFFRREGRPSEQAILTCRLIDRPLRPSFSDNYRNETHVVITSLAVDQENPFDVIALERRLGCIERELDPLPGTRSAPFVSVSRRGSGSPSRPMPISTSRCSSWWSPVVATPRAGSTSSWSRPVRRPTACV